MLSRVQDNVMQRAIPVGEPAYPSLFSVYFPVTGVRGEACHTHAHKWCVCVAECVCAYKYT